MPNNPESANDYLGRPIKPGDVVVYPVRRGSRMWLNRLHVQAVEITPRGPSVSGYNNAGRRIAVHNLENCVILREEEKCRSTSTNANPADTVSSCCKD